MHRVVERRGVAQHAAADGLGVRAAQESRDVIDPPQKRQVSTTPEHNEDAVNTLGVLGESEQADFYGDEAREVLVQPVEGFEAGVLAYSVDHSWRDVQRAVTRGDRERKVRENLRVAHPHRLSRCHAGLCCRRTGTWSSTWARTR